jgi:hypothetical protein
MSPSLDGGHGVPGSLVGGGFRDDRNGYTMHTSTAKILRAPYNATNGLWAFRFRDGRRLRLQSAGGLLSAERTPAGRQSTSLIADRLIHHNVRVFGV